MAVDELLPDALRGERDFRWRGGNVSRIEGLSDAVFALCLTLLVVSLDVPDSFAGMAAAFEQVPAFAACFAVFALWWFQHYRFHRRYGLEDGFTIVVNSVLLFTVLLYVYPLRFLFTCLAAMFLGLGGGEAHLRTAITGEQWPTLMLIYSTGFALICSLFALLYGHAARHADALELDAVERHLTRHAVHDQLLSAAFGVVSLTLVLVNPRWFPAAGIVYCLMGPAHAWLGRRAGRRLATLRSARGEHGKQSDDAG